MNKIFELINLAKQFNSLIDNGESLEIKHLHIQLENKQLFEWLKTIFKDSLNLSSFSNQDMQEIEDIFYQISITNEPEDDGVVSNALALLIAYCLVGIELTYTIQTQLK